MTRLTIDLRMYRNSGIGRYLQNLIPHILPLLQADRIRIVGNRPLFGPVPWLDRPQVELFDTTAAVYSPQEQLLPLRGAYADTTLLWVPHYNAPLLYRGPLALTIHDIAPLALPGIMGSKLKATYAATLIRQSVSRARAILCDSAFTARELETRLHADAAKLTVVHLGPDKDWPDSAPAHVESDAVPYLLYVGNVKPNKNLSTLLTAFATVLDRIPHRLVLAGRVRGFGTEDAAVLDQAAKLGDRVRFTDEISDAELISLYAGATALVLPSLYEGFGLPLLEAMQLGCPILCSDYSSLPEIAGPAALLFNPRDPASIAAQLLRVTDQATLETLRQAGLKRIHDFSYTTCAQQTAAVLNPLLQQ